jgi:hypothetical protein
MRELPSGIQTARPTPLPPPLNNVRTRPSATLMVFNCQLASLPAPSVGAARVLPSGDQVAPKMNPA